MWPNPQETADLVTFTDEILNEKLHFLCSGKVLSSRLLNVFVKISFMSKYYTGYSLQKDFPTQGTLFFNLHQLLSNS